MDDQGTNREGGGIRFRKLRIAWSLVFGILCLLLIALWVRSYYYHDILELPVPKSRVATGPAAHILVAAFHSIHGMIEALPNVEAVPDYFGNDWWRRQSRAVDFDKQQMHDFYTRQMLELFDSVPWYLRVFRVSIVHRPLYVSIQVSHCCLFLLTATLAAIPWFPWPTRFSLRTLLIVTALIAVGLGAIMYVVK